MPKPKKPTPKRVKATKPVHPKAPFSFGKNVVPPLLGILVTLSILGLLNAQWIIAQAQYRFIKVSPSSELAITTQSPDPNAPPHIMIPKLNIDAPIVVDEKSYDNSKAAVALRRGVLQYGVSANPGQIGNVVILGHSSGQLWAPGDYKFVFTLLDKLGRNDQIFVDFEGTRYIYRVTDTQIVPPTDLNVLQNSATPTLTLITCTPVGTAKNRLIVNAKQVVPNPSTSTPLDPNAPQPPRTGTLISN